MYYSETKNNKQESQEHYFNYAYPIRFDDKEWIVSITVKEDYNGKRFYDNEFVQEIKATDGLPNGTGPSTRGNPTHPSALDILQDILFVKPDAVSKVVDENEEPKPLYCGTNAFFDTFDAAKSGSKSQTGAPAGSAT